MNYLKLKQKAMARPTENNPKGEQKSPVMSPEVIQKLETAFSMGANQAEACLHADINESTFSTWKKRKPELAKNLMRLKSKPALLAKSTLLKGIGKDPNLALRYLERVSPDEFSTRTENINTNITVEDVMSQFDDPDKLNSEDDEITESVQHKE